ncbi:hypothetical protein ACH47X_01675 [Promicromonospora kroppenstedtii]|uniref:Uncharacterized protein n=1 Tax=Promicromonospora kroppenstedtii TaxID=440482 RepID=A0ABW7XDM0_9MICO
MITSEMVSILSVGLPALGAVVSAFAAFLGVVPGTDRKLHRLVTIHRDMPAGEGRDALEDSINELAVRAARRAVGGRTTAKQRPRRRLDAGKVIGAIMIVVVGGGIAWVFWWLGSLIPLPFLQWVLWVIAILVTLFTTFVVTLDNVFKDENGDRTDRSAKGTTKDKDAKEPAPEDAPVPAPADGV